MILLSRFHLPLVNIGNASIHPFLDFWIDAKPLDNASKGDPELMLSQINVASHLCGVIHSADIACTSSCSLEEGLADLQG